MYTGRHVYVCVCMQCVQCKVSSPREGGEGRGGGGVGWGGEGRGGVG